MSSILPNYSHSFLESLWGCICHQRKRAEAECCKLKTEITSEVAVQFTGVWVLIQRYAPFVHSYFVHILNVTFVNYIQVEKCFLFIYTPLSSATPPIIRRQSKNVVMWQHFWVLLRKLQGNKSLLTSVSLKQGIVLGLGFRVPPRWSR